MEEMHDTSAERLLAHTASSILYFPFKYPREEGGDTAMAQQCAIAQPPVATSEAEISKIIGNSWRAAHREKSAAVVQPSKMHEKNGMDSSVGQPPRIFLAACGSL